MPDPGSRALDLVRSFANTSSAEPDTDLLRACGEAAAWLRTTGLLPAEAGLTNSEHAALLRLREAVRDVLAAHGDGREDADAAGRLTKTLVEGRVVVTVDPASTVRLASAARASYPSVVAGIAVAIAEAAAAGSWLGLKCCSAPGCDQACYDESGPARCSAHPAG